MTDDRKVEVEELKKNEDVRRALEQTAGNRSSTKAVVETKHMFWLGTYVILLLAFVCAGVA